MYQDAALYPCTRTLLAFQRYYAFVFCHLKTKANCFWNVVTVCVQRYQKRYQHISVMFHMLNQCQKIIWYPYTTPCPTVLICSCNVYRFERSPHFRRTPQMIVTGPSISLNHGQLTNQCYMKTKSLQLSPVSSLLMNASFWETLTFQVSSSTSTLFTHPWIFQSHYNSSMGSKKSG